MRHKVKGKKFSRNTNQRKALFKSLLKGIIKNGEIKTTLTKAKVSQRILEGLITDGKKGDLACRRRIYSVLQDKKLSNKLVDEISPLFKSRAGGYLRIIKLMPRGGDNAKMAKVELVEKIEEKKKMKTEDKPKDIKVDSKEKLSEGK